MNKDTFSLLIDIFREYTVTVKGICANKEVDNFSIDITRKIITIELNEELQDTEVQPDS